MKWKHRVLLALTLLCLLKVGEVLAEVTPATLEPLTPINTGNCRLTTNVYAPCERYFHEGKYYLALYALVDGKPTLVKIILIHEDGSLRTQKTEWMHELLWI